MKKVNSYLTGVVVAAASAGTPACAQTNTATFYRNRVLLTSIPHSVIARESTHTLNIGRNPTGAEYWQGRLDEIRIWDRVRTAAEIEGDENRSLTGNEPGLIGDYPFSEESGTTTTDASPAAGDGTLIGCTWVAGPSLLEPLTHADPA